MPVTKMASDRLTLRVGSDGECHIRLNGVTLDNVTRVSFEAEARDYVEVTLSLFCEVTLDGEFSEHYTFKSTTKPEDKEGVKSLLQRPDSGGEDRGSMD